MSFDPTEPPDLAVWRANTDGAQCNLTREVRASIEQTTEMMARLKAGVAILNSDTRRLTATVFELSRYATELDTLRNNRPHDN